MILNKHVKTRHRRGVALVEFAAVVPVVLLLLVGLFEIGRLVEVQQAVANSAREGGRQASTGAQSQAGVTLAVKNYLARAGYVTTNVNVTLVNLTDATRSDPTTANQLDEFQVTVTMPYNDARWILLRWFTNGRILTETATWLSMRDVPLAINSTIPNQ